MIRKIGLYPDLSTLGPLSGHVSGAGKAELGGMSSVGVENGAAAA
jgi:hypothetical protein